MFGGESPDGKGYAGNRGGDEEDESQLNYALAVKGEGAVEDSGEAFEVGWFAVKYAVVGGRAAVAGQIDDGSKHDYESGERDAGTEQVADTVLNSLICPRVI